MRPPHVAIPNTIVSARVEARPHAGNCFGAAFFGLTGVGLVIASLLLSRSEPNQRLLWYALGLLISLPLIGISLLVALWVSRACVIADEDGLRWRSIGRWRVATWDEVTDYYEQHLPNRRHGLPVVETRAGRLPLGSDLTHRDALLAVIAARAVQARVRSWGEKGMRAEDDWPRIFGYDTAHNRAAPWISGGSLAVLIVTMGWMLLPKTQGLVEEVGWPLGLGATLLALCLALGVPAALVLPTLPIHFETRRRRGQTVTVDLHGLRYSAPGREVAVCWDEVKAYFIGSAPGWVQVVGPAVVVTARGTFDFLPTLEDATQLRALIRRHAVSASTNQWHETAPERLGGEAALWSGGSCGVGQRVYHYRTRTNRALLLFAGGHWLALAVSASFGPLRERLATDPAWVLGSAVVSTVALLWLTWRYRTAAILVDERGITQRAWNGSRFLAWAEVEELSTSGAESFQFGNVTGRGQRIRFWLSIADLDELQSAISNRSANATRSGWQSRELD